MSLVIRNTWQAFGDLLCLSPRKAKNTKEKMLLIRTELESRCDKDMIQHDFKNIGKDIKRAMDRWNESK